MRRRLPVDELLEFDSRSVVKFMKHFTKQLGMNGNPSWDISGTLKSPFHCHEAQMALIIDRWNILRHVFECGMSTSIIERDSRGRGSISLNFKVAEAALSFSASPADDIDQYEGEGEAWGRLRFRRESLAPTHATDPTTDSLATVSYRDQHMTL